MVKIYYMGKRYNTKWQVFVSIIKKLSIRIVWILILTSLVVGLILIGRSMGEVKYKEVEKEVILDNLTEKINELKGSLVSDIRQCESNGYSEDYGLITFDPHKTNTKVAPASIGVYQFKVETVKYYYKTIYGKDITGKEAILIALDEKKSNQLASDIIFKTDNGLTNWYNCSNKINAKGRLEVIRQLEK